MNITQSQEQIKLNPLIKEVMDENNPLMLEVLNCLIYLSHQHHHVFISQGTIAAKFNVSVKWVNRLLARWKALGVIRYRQQGFNRSCLYIINPLLFYERNRLKWKLSALNIILHVTSLCSGVFSEEFLLSNIRNIHRKKYQVIEVRNEGYGFYEEGYGKTEKYIIEDLFINNKQQPSGNQYCPQRRESMETNIMQKLASAFSLNAEQAEQYSNQYSKSVLNKALQSFEKQRTKRKITNPKGWLAWVLADEERKEQEQTSRSSKGKEGGHSGQSRNPGGHSPASEVPNLTHMQQIEYLMKEIMKFSQAFDPDKVYSPDPQMNEYLKKIARNSIAGMQREVDQLLKTLDDPTHVCLSGCVDKSQFLRAPKQELTVDFSQPTSDEEYEEHLDDVSKDMSDPFGYKELVREYDYRRTARKA